MFLVVDSDRFSTVVVKTDKSYLYALHYFAALVFLIVILTLHSTGVIQALKDYLEVCLADLHSSCLIRFNIYLRMSIFYRNPAIRLDCLTSVEKCLSANKTSISAIYIEQEHLDMFVKYYCGLYRSFRSFPSELMEVYSVNHLIYWSMKLKALEEPLEAQQVLLERALHSLRSPSSIQNGNNNARTHSRLRLLKTIYRANANLRNLRRQNSEATHQLRLHGKNFYSRLGEMTSFKQRLIRDCTRDFWVETEFPDFWMQKEDEDWK